MLRALRSTVLVAATMAGGLLVGSTAAYADDVTTNLSKAEMVAALKAVATTSTTAANAGLRGSATMSVGSGSGTAGYAIDPVGGMAYMKVAFGGFSGIGYAVQHKGTYEYLNDSTSLAAVKMMGRPAVRYSFTAKASLTLSGWVADNEVPTPAVALSDEVEAGTKTLHDDGSVDYAYTLKDEVGEEEETIDTDVTLHVDAAGLLTTTTSEVLGYRQQLTLAYGPQKITPPAASATVAATTLAKAKAYVTMATRVQKAANDGAAHTRKAAKGKKVNVTSLRATVRKDAAAVNKTAGVAMVKVTNVAGGVRVFATNPWTHKTVAYTVKASGKKVVVNKA
jgi:hypothetical protein